MTVCRKEVGILAVCPSSIMYILSIPVRIGLFVDHYSYDDSLSKALYVTYDLYATDDRAITLKRYFLSILPVLWKWLPFIYVLWVIAEHNYACLLLICWLQWSYLAKCLRCICTGRNNVIKFFSTGRSRDYILYDELRGKKNLLATETYFLFRMNARQILHQEHHEVF